MSFDHKFFIHIAKISIADLKNIPSKYRFKRAVFLLIFLALFPIMELINAFCFFMDDLLFPGYQKKPVEHPVFIIGNPRSGTTFLHRLLSLDEGQFFFFKTWEILSPAMVQKKFWAMIGRIDTVLGNVFSNVVVYVETILFKDFNKLHKVSLFLPEEDDKLTFHIFGCIDLIWFFPFDDMDQFNHFDEAIHYQRQNIIMNYYKKCIQKQAFFKNGHRCLLSKGPALSCKIENIYRHFPGCRIIYLVRNPMEVIPSMCSMSKALWKFTQYDHANNEFAEKIFKTLSHYYNYPLSRLSSKDPKTYYIVRYDDLIENPMKTVQDIYRHFDLHLTSNFEKTLKKQNFNKETYKSDHVYSLQESGLDSERIQEELGDMIDRFWPSEESR